MTDNSKRETGSDPALVRASLDRILASRGFKASPKIQNLLRFLVESTLAGKAARLKAYTIGVEVLGRGADFDPDSDSLVRTSATRLRRLLDAYYAAEGRHERLRIRLGRGSYVPEFALAGDPSRADGRGRVRVAVERLAFIGGSDQPHGLAAGLTEELVVSLSCYGGRLVAVAAPAWASGEPVPALPGDHTIEYHLRGQLRRHADAFRVHMTLVESGTGLVAWNDTLSYRFSPTGLFEIQERIARRVASTVLGPHGVVHRCLKRQPAELLGTYLAVFLYHEYQESFSPETHLRARETLEQTIHEEPDFAEAWAALGNVYLGEALFGFNAAGTPAAAIEKGLAATQKAVALDPRNPMAHYSLAMLLYYRGERAQFLAESDRALALAPYLPDNLATVGMHLAMAGEWERGIALVREAIGLHPLHPPWYHLTFSLAHLHAGEPAEALAVLGRFAALDFFPFQTNLAVIHGLLGNGAEARKCLERMVDLWPEARQEIPDILAVWFPYGDLADIFWEGLAKAGFQFAAGPGVDAVRQEHG